jgi:hypothetical protein
MSDMDMPAQRDETIPNFLMLKQIPVNYIQQVETDLLEPVVFNQGAATTDGFCRFVLQNKGFLSSHSKIFMALKPDSTITNAFLSPHLGIGQVIKKAVLKIGNKQINEIDSWAGLYGVKSSLITNENNLEREQYLTGRYLNHDFDYSDGSKALADGYAIDNGVAKNGTNFKTPTWSVMDGSLSEQCPSYSLDLSDLFPFLKVHQLPLYMINEPVTIELTFQPTQKHRVQIASGQTTEKDCEIVRDQLKFCADYIFYGATDEMDRFAQANGDLSFSFVDYRVVEHSTTASALTSGIVRNLGMANRIVPRIIVTTVKTNDNEETLLGQYNARSPEVNASGVQQAFKYNVRYNDRFEFTSDVDNTARMFSIFTDSESVPFVTRDEYSDQGVAGQITGFTFQGRPQNTNLAGHFFYMGTRLTNGRVGQRGIELHLTTAAPTNTDLLRCYCEYVRVARLVGGSVEVYNA